ncbi:type II toxin-antitoxin system ParD family antitoxin [Neorhizobium sp. DAR64860/K0K1]|uniref:type II toxin-antitoxin system ParD family antitoxin n=1 Tax=Neorhizobium sp. DAR64860/K0K1 TaxID=3421955 RepID=UPI003D283945
MDLVPSSYELGPHYESFVRRPVESGRYASESDVMRDSLRLLEEMEEHGKAGFDALKADIRTGIESGPGIPADDVFDRLEARYGGRRS